MRHDSSALRPITRGRALGHAVTGLVCALAIIGPGWALPLAVSAASIRDVDTPPMIDAGLLAPRDPQHPDAWLEWEPAIRALAAGAEQLVPSNPAPPPGPVNQAAAIAALRHYIVAREAMTSGRARVALPYLERARQNDPNSPAILRLLAHAFAILGESARERATYSELFQLEPADSEARFAMALMALGQRDARTCATLISAALVDDGRFVHDGGADLIADHALHIALITMGFDRAAIEAGRRVAVDPVFDETTRYRARVIAVLRDRASTWRSIGDAHARLGEFADALEAWEAAAEFAPDEHAVMSARRVFALLSLDRVAEAEAVVLDWLVDTTAGARADAVAVAEYIVSQTGGSEPFVTSMERLLRQRPDDSPAAAAAAVVMHPEDATALVGRYVRSHPRDRAVVGRLIQLLGEVDPDGAIELVVDLMDRAPDRARSYAAHLLTGVPDVLDRVQGDTSSPALVEIAARLLMHSSGAGPAWQRCRAALDRWPDDPRLLRLQIELAGVLDEPVWLERALSAGAELTDTRTACVRATALAAQEQYDAGVETAERALADASTPEDRRLAFETVVRTHAARTQYMDADERRQTATRRTFALVRQFRQAFPEEEMPYELEAFLHGSRGLDPDPESFHSVAASVRTLAPDSALCGRLIAQDAINFGRHELAIERALPLVARDATDVESIDLVLSAWEQLDRGEDAEQWLRAQVERFPGDPVYLDRLVRRLLAYERGDDAETVLQARLRDRPDDPAAHRLLELVYQVTGRMGAALPLAEQRLEQRPPGTRRALQHALLYARAGRIEDAIERLMWIADRVDQASTRHMVGAIGLAGRLDMEQERRDEITALLVERAVAAHPATSIHIYMTGLRALGAVGTTPRFRALAEQAAMHATGGGTDGSITQLLAWRELAQTMLDAGRAERAAIALRARLETALNGTLLGATPLEPDAMTLLTAMIIAVEGARPGGAERCIELLTDLAARGRLPVLPGTAGPSTLARALAGTADLYGLVGNETGAEQMRRMALELNPHDGMTKNNLGYMLIEEGRHDAQTVEWIEQAAAQFEDDASVTDTLAWLRYKQGRLPDENGHEGAVTLLRRAMRLSDGEEPEVLDHLGDALWRLGDAEGAADHWRRAMDVLTEPGRSDETMRRFRVLQQLQWGLLVADPEEMYYREIQPLIERLQRKLTELERGGDAPVAPTFEELLPPG